MHPRVPPDRAAAEHIKGILHPYMSISIEFEVVTCGPAELWDLLHLPSHANLQTGASPGKYAVMDSSDGRLLVALSQSAPNDYCPNRCDPGLRDMCTVALERASREHPSGSMYSWRHGKSWGLLQNGCLSHSAGEQALCGRLRGRAAERLQSAPVVAAKITSRRSCLHTIPLEDPVQVHAPVV